MKVKIITPHGYCNGVKNALNKAKNVLLDPNTPKPIYLLGSLIHNRYANEELTKLGAIIIEEKGMTRLEMLDSISTGTVIVSAHGASKNVFEKARNKGLNIVDLTCPSVLKIHNDINKYLNEGYTCYFIGKRNHAETEGILGINEKIKLIEDENFILDEKAYVTNQSTLSLIDTSNIYEKIKINFPNAIINNHVCLASTNRQLAVLNQEKVDLCIVVGDKTSSNSLRLKEITTNINIDSIFVEDLNELLTYDLSKYESISITAGASTPEYLLDEILEYLKKNKA